MPGPRGTSFKDRRGCPRAGCDGATAYSCDHINASGEFETFGNIEWHTITQNAPTHRSYTPLTYASVAGASGQSLMWSWSEHNTTDGYTPNATTTQDSLTAV
jgi:hypothetical protein